MGIQGLIFTATTRGKGREVISCKRYGYWKDYWSGLPVSRIYPFGEKSRVAEGHELLRGVRGHYREMF